MIQSSVLKNRLSEFFSSLGYIVGWKPEYFGCLGYTRGNSVAHDIGPSGFIF